MAHVNGVPLPSPTGSIPEPSTQLNTQIDFLLDMLRNTEHGFLVLDSKMDLSRFTPMGSIDGGHQIHIMMDGPDEPRGRYLCEGCWDAMTDLVMPAAQSSTGLEMALCATCQCQTQGGQDD